MDSSTDVTTPTRRRWLIETLQSVAKAADDGDVLLLPWSRCPGRAQRKASARARALAE